jgi:hypothetical protein
MVAMVLFAGAGMSLYAWVSTNVLNLSQALRSAERLAAESTALEYIQSINPVIEPAGEFNLKEYHVTWNAEPYEASRRGTSTIGGWSNYRIGLFEIKAILEKDGEVVSHLNFRHVGYERLTQGIAPGF